MRNLKLLSQRNVDIGVECHFLALDNESDSVYFGSGLTVVGYSLDNLKKCFDLDINASDLYTNLINLDSKIVGLEFLCGEEQLCIILKHGDILLCSTSDKQVVCVGTLDCNLCFMSWSPDQEIVLLVTDKGTVVAMNHDFDPITELKIFANVFGEGDFVNVGWGSKETQFQGSSGKFMPDAQKSPIAATLLHDDNMVKVAWRGDGQYFAISTIENGQRKFRIWNRACELQYTSESIPGLESCFAWKPSGSLLASSQRKVHRHDIIFFELNGLQHGEFTLPFKTDQVFINKLEWNSDSTILAILSSDLFKNVTYLQLWTVSNYQWSLKQSIELEEKIMWMSWDSEQLYHLHVCFQNGIYTQYHWRWSTDCSRLSCASTEEKSCSDLSMVCVVDGTRLKLTPFSYMVVPPPMCAFQISFKTTVSAVCFLEDSFEINTIGILLNDGCFITFVNHKTGLNFTDVKIDQLADGGSDYSLVVPLYSCNGIFEPKKDPLMSFWWRTLRHLVWNSSNQLTAVAFLEKKDFIVTLSLDKANLQLVLEKKLPVHESIIAMCSGRPVSDTLVQFKDGQVFVYDIDLKPLNLIKENLQFAYPCPDMQLCSFTNPISQEKSYGLIGLSLQNRLFLNNVVLSTECTSFYVHQEYLIFTTSSHKLIFVSKFIDLESFVKTKSNSSYTVKGDHQITRTVERGARLVVVTPHDTKTVLQLPRGNLEVIYPRPLVISVVKHDLDHQNYKNALVLMRKNRINMNLIHDHDSAKFFKNVDVFVKSLDSVEFINLFLGELQEEDVTSFMYKQFYPSRLVKPASILNCSASKVDRVCEAVLRELYNENSVKYFLCILTAYVKKSSPQIEKALCELKRMKKEKLLDDDSVNNALRHLHVMVDGRVLYREALATYDLDLALTVAQVSNNDPKEYLPFLNELKSLEENFKRYKIDLYLKRYSEALKNISKCPEHFSECTDLIRKHHLHREALSLFTRYTPEYAQISNMYAEVLTSQHLYEEAGIMLARSGNHKRAIKCFVASCSWQHALNSAAFLQYSKESFCNLGKSLAQNLVSKQKYLPAALVLEEIGDYSGALAALCDGKLWPDALRLIRLHKLPDLVDTLLIPSLKQSCSDLMGFVQSYREQFEKRFIRLQLVREIKREKELRVFSSFLKIMVKFPLFI